MEFRIQTCNIANSRSGLSHSSCHQTHYFIYKSKQLIDHWSWIVPSSRNQAKVDIGTSQAIRGICVSKFISSLRSNPSLVHQLQLNMGLPSPVNKKGRKGTRTYATRCDGPHQQVLIWVTTLSVSHCWHIAVPVCLNPSRFLTLHQLSEHLCVSIRILPKSRHFISVSIPNPQQHVSQHYQQCADTYIIQPVLLDSNDITRDKLPRYWASTTTNLYWWLESFLSFFISIY